MMMMPTMEIIFFLFETVTAGVFGDEFFLRAGVLAAVHRPVTVD
jgi:hypothetical protein